jgi:CheY-like chemotaxis protein
MISSEIRQDILQGWDVLVIDDEPDSLEVASHILRFYQANVMTASTRLIISDLSMPVMDGWELIFELKNDRTTSDIPVIALTAHAMIGDRTRAIGAGFHNYLTKPLTPSTFMRDLLGLLTEIPELRSELAL